MTGDLFLAALGALAVGVSLGLLGSGGSILTVPVLVYVVGVPEKLAVVESLWIVAGVAASGALRMARRGLIAWPAVVAFGGPSMVAAALAGRLSAWLSGSLQLTIFAVVMLTAAAGMARRHLPEAQPRQSPLATAALGAAVGVVTGTVGVGGGFLIVPSLVLRLQLPLQRAIGTSLAVVAANALAGGIGALSAPAVSSLDWGLVGGFVAVGAVGTWAGHHLAGALPPVVVRRIFAVVLLVVAVGILADQMW
jgi:uncharacterized membrane protein YfcA